jgi:hypothetical protein
LKFFFETLQAFKIKKKEIEMNLKVLVKHWQQFEKKKKIRN